MLDISFEYKDRYTHGNWSKQKCRMESVQQCIDFYGLGVDCEYRITSVVDVATGKQLNIGGTPT